MSKKRTVLSLALVILLGAGAASAQITEIIDSTGDGTNSLTSPVEYSVTVDGSGNVYVVGRFSVNVFKIATPGTCSTGGTPCTITEIIDATGDGTNTLNSPTGIAVDSSGNAYVVDRSHNNVFRITPGGTITRIIDFLGDGTNFLQSPEDVAVDAAGNVYVTGWSLNNAFKIATPGSCSTGGTPCTITQIIDATGDGGGNTLAGPTAIEVDGAGNVFVVGSESDNAFKITPGGTVTEVIDATGDGGGNVLDAPLGVATDGADNVYVGGANSDNVFKITPGGAITQIIDSTGDGMGNVINGVGDVAADAAGNVYVTSPGGSNAFKIAATPPAPVPAASTVGLAALVLAALALLTAMVRRRAAA